MEHRLPQTLRTFVDLHCRYGRVACMYQAKRRRRGTGTMREDPGSRGSLPGHLWRLLGWRRSTRIGAALAPWQVADAVGFFTHACAGEVECDSGRDGQPRGLVPPRPPEPLRSSSR